MLDEHDWVRFVDDGAHWSVRVGRIGRNHDLESHHRCEDRLEALGVLCSRRSSGAVLRSHHEGCLDAPAGHESQFGRLVEQLIEAHAEEVDEHQLGDGTHAGHRSPDR